MDNVRFGGSLSVPYYTQVPHDAVKEEQQDLIPLEISPVVDVPVTDPEPEKEPVEMVLSRPNALYELPDVNVDESQETHDDLHDIDDEHRPFNGKKKRR